jgi:Zn-dependent protease with chaperone function
MTEEQWGELVRRLEPQARANPRAYGRKVALLGALGYGFLAVSLLVLTALIALVVWGAIAGTVALLKFIIPIGAVALVILRSLAVKLDPPEGIPLREDQAPDLFRMITEVNERVRGPKIHDVIVNGDLNAGVVQIPRRGGIFGQRNYLVLGLPYMQALSPEEFRAVIAHELGHLSKDHGRFGAWIYRIQMTWWQLLRALEEKGHWGSGIFRRFFRWYAPYFEAYSYPLRRAHEFEADQAAAEAAGARPAATSLLAGAIAGRYLDEEYWPQVFRRADDEREPPSAFAPMREHLSSVRAHTKANTWVQQELTRTGEPHDTHPTTAERIRQLGLDPEEILRSATTNGGAQRQTAAQAYLGTAETNIAEQIDQDWHRAVGRAWFERYHEAQRLKSDLEELDQRASSADLSLEDAYKRADLTEAFRSADAALPLYRAVLEREPGHAPAHFAIGRILLAQKDDAGLTHLERAMEADPEAVLPACETAFFYLKEQGLDEEAERFRARGEKQLDTFARASEERGSVTAEDRLLPHELPNDVVENLRSQLARYEEVDRAYLVRKDLRHLADEYPLYVVGIVRPYGRRTLWRQAKDPEDQPSLAQRLASELKLPVDFLVVVPGPRSKLNKRFAAVSGAEMYRR